MADVQRDPGLLRVHAREAEELASGLAAALAGEAACQTAAQVDEPPGRAAERERIVAVLRGAVRELTDLAVALRTAARVDDADTAAAHAVRRVLRP